MYTVEEEEMVLDGEKVVVYGIKCGGEYIPNITSNRVKAQDMADMFNKYELSPCHFYDVVSDMI